MRVYVCVYLGCVLPLGQLLDMTQVRSWEDKVVSKAPGPERSEGTKPQGGDGTAPDWPA